MNFQTCQNRLTLLWFITSGLIFFVMLIQTVLGSFEDGGKTEWAWLLPSIVPTLSLIVGILVAQAVGQKNINRTETSSFLFWLVFSISGFYLLILATIILLQPFSALPAPQIMTQSQQLWLGPLQGIVSASLAAYFYDASNKT